MPSSSLSQSAIDDLLSLGIGIPQPQQQTPTSNGLLENPWGGPAPDPWTPANATTSTESQCNFDIFLCVSIQFLVYPLLNSTAPSTSTPLAPASNDPWAPVNDSTPSALLPSSSAAAATNDPWAAFNAEPIQPLAPTPASSSNGTNGMSIPNGSMGQQRPNLKTPETFLGENSSLVNLDNLMGPASTQPKPGSNLEFGLVLSRVRSMVVPIA